ncbi:MAG: hypothetical protein Barrevirus3_3 [Barrevirus sp.]|uniref:Uncharacterized protein n=1 Tax=Barrevirus sp. TaxID=2487763 RepID=A0A3G4ZTF2_9VIRU|nr:MAG: hypothetical protein Barrevirus3_3 [Barrevirus sp.]
MENPNKMNSSKEDTRLILVPVPGNLTCAAHSFVLSLLSAGLENHAWFNSIKDVLLILIRENHNVDGQLLNCQIRTHLLRDLVVDTVEKFGEPFFVKEFGKDKFYWDDLIAADIRGINEETKRDPSARSFLDHANPFFMVCSYLFQCNVRIVMDDGNVTTFSSRSSNYPVTIQVRSNATMNSLGTHFDAFILPNLGPNWLTDLDPFYGVGDSYVYNGELVHDVILKINDWYRYLGDRYQDVLKAVSKKNYSESNKTLEENRRMALELSKKIEEATRISAELSKKLEEDRKIEAELNKKIAADRLIAIELSRQIEKDRVVALELEKQLMLEHEQVEKDRWMAKQQQEEQNRRIEKDNWINQQLEIQHKEEQARRLSNQQKQAQYGSNEPASWSINQQPVQYRSSEPVQYRSNEPVQYRFNEPVQYRSNEPVSWVRNQQLDQQKPEPNESYDDFLIRVLF